MRHVRLNIAGTYYNENQIVSMRSHRAVFEDAPSVGNCVSGELEVTLFVGNVSIPRNAKVVPYVKEDGEGWNKKSEFYIYSRSTDYVSGALKIIAYDAIFKAESPFVQPGDIGYWPRTDKNVMQEIARRTGTIINADSLAYLNKGYMVQFPGITVEGDSGADYEVDGTTMREVAGYVASMYAGNWIIDNAGQWRLIVLGDVPPVTNYLIEEHGDTILIGGVRILV